MRLCEPVRLWNYALIVTTLGALAGCNLFNSPEKRIARAEQQLAAGDYGGAMLQLKNAIAAQPGNARAQLVLARVSLQTGNPAAAAKALDAAASSGGDQALISELRARLRLQRNEFEALLKDLDGGLLQLAEPLRSEVRAQAQLGMRRFDEATAGFRAVIAKASDPLLTEAQLGLAQSLAGQGNTGLAMKTLEQAAGKSARPAAVWLAMGSLQQMTGQVQQAEASWIRALAEATSQLTLMQHVALLNGLAEARLTRGDLDGAKTLYDALASSAPQSAFTGLLSARLALARDDAAAATAALQRLQSQFPSFNAVRPVLIASLLAQGAIEQAGRQVDELLQSAPDDARLKSLQATMRSVIGSQRDSGPYYFAIAAIQAALGQQSAAHNALLKAERADPRSMLAGSALVMLEMRAGRTDEALNRAKGLAAGRPADMGAKTMLADVYMARGQYSEAAAILAEAWQKQPSAERAARLSLARRLGGMDRFTEPLDQWVAQNPADNATRLLLAQALQAANQDGRAIAEYQRVLAAMPNNLVALNNLAWLYYTAKDARALATARKAYDIAPQSPQVSDTYGWLLLQGGNSVAAVKVLQQAVQAGHGDPDIAYHYAAALVAAGRQVPLARQFLEGALANPARFLSRSSAEQLLAGL